MKKLSEMSLLSGESEVISLSELRSNPGDVFAQVQMGKEFTVSKNGEPVANIVKHQPFDLAVLQQLRKNSSY